MVVADRLAFFTTRLLNDSARFGAAWLFLGMVMYSIQIYCDFAGYSAVAIGISNLFGIELTENFHAPYLSRNISEFWRKWHISLSRWLRDYIYIPLGGSRKGNARRFLNTAIVFIICGIWHGADASFLAWGLLHGFYVMAFGLYSEAKRKRATGKEPASIMNVAGMVFTFLIVSFAWIFFGAPNIGSGACYVGRMLSMTPGVDSFAAQAADIGASRRDMILPIYGVVVLALDLLIARKDKRIGRAMQGIPDVARYAILYGMIMAILLLGIYGPGYNASSFMYVNDLIEGLMRMLSTAPLCTGPVNLGNPAETPIKDLARKVLSLTGSKSDIVQTKQQKDDPLMRCPDISFASKVLQGWKPDVDLDTGLNQTIEYFKKKALP